MDKEKIVEDFFRSFKVTLSNAFSYSKGHPYFVKSVEIFKLKLETALTVLNPLKIGVTSLELVVDELHFTRAGLYDKLANLLHQRKIKSIEIRKDATLQELIHFFCVISLPQKEFLKNGNLAALLAKEPLTHFTIQELDYSVFLNQEGQECTDLWSYLLDDALQSNDEAKINTFADDFSQLIKRTDQNNLLQNPGISTRINDFLLCLKNQDKERFAKFSKDLFLWLLHNKESMSQEKIAKFKQIFDSLDQEDFSALFWEGLTHEDNFNALSLQFFSKIAEQKNPEEIAQGISNKFNATGHLNNPQVVKRIQNLLTTPQDDNMSAVYRNTLASLIKGISSAGGLSFDLNILKENYRYIVLNILSTDEDEDNLLLATEVLEKELPKIFEDDSLDFLKDLWSQVIKKNKEGRSLGIGLEKKFSIFVEDIILHKSLSFEQEWLLEIVSTPHQEKGFYLNSIFAAEEVNKQALGLFFKFFPNDLDIFYQRAELRLQDLDFLFSLIEALAQLTTPVSLKILDQIYSSVNELIKVEILNIMGKLKKVDTQFLMRQLGTDSVVLRKSLLSVLILDAQAVEAALNLLLKIHNFGGRNNDLLIENMQIVFDLGLIQAVEQIRNLSRKRFFWNWELRAKAKQILKEWNAY